MADAQQQVLDEEFTFTSSGTETSDSVHGVPQTALPPKVAPGGFNPAGGRLYAHTIPGTD